MKMKYEYIFIVWLLLYLKLIIDYRQNMYSDYVYKIMQKVSLLELILLLSIYLIIDNRLPDLFYRENISFWVIMLLISLLSAIGCYPMRIIKKVSDDYKNRNAMNEMPSMEKWMHDWCLVTTDEHFWIICVLVAFWCSLALLYTLLTGDYGEIRKF